jgi:plant G-box-binding factor
VSSVAFVSIVLQLKQADIFQELKLCRLVVNLLAYIASSGKLGYQVLLDSVTANGSSFLELIMEVLASQMEQEVDFSTEAHELLKER